MASKPERSPFDEVTSDLLRAIDDAAAVLCSTDQGVVFLDPDEDPEAIVLAVVEAERARGRLAAILWAFDRTWMAWHWPEEEAPPLLGFLLSDEVEDAV
ncbi:MAG: hypothetical protein AB7F65_03675 [Dehalococcoidia bacterium]